VGARVDAVRVRRFLVDVAMLAVFVPLYFLVLTAGKAVHWF